MKFTSKSLLQVLACTVVTLGAVSLAQAGMGANVDVFGTWTWTGGGGGRGFAAAAAAAAVGGRSRWFSVGGTNVLVLKADVTTGVVTAR